ncbi:MAG: hypothetical protein Q7I94_04795 [Candidatus Contubernalis sp.]|nr:hypothetical protein [Candidatus Contubernalis sp.]
MGRLGCTCNDLLMDIDLESRVMIRDGCEGVLTGTISNVTDTIIQLDQVPDRTTNVCCGKICSIRNLTPEEEEYLVEDLPPLMLED